MARYQAFHTTVVGISHTKHGKECQDYSLHVRGKNDLAALAVVADGHGADECFRSAKGAELAVKCAGQGIWEFVRFLHEKPKSTFLVPNVKLTQDIGLAPKPPVDTLSAREIEAKIRESLIRDGFIRAWYRAVQADYTAHPFTPAELAGAGEKYRKRYEEAARDESGEGLHKAYGSTLIACAVTPKYWFGIHIGDGRLTALYPDGSYDQPVPWDEKCFLNQTTSICDDDAAERARVYFSFHNEKPPPAAVFLCSDGVDDNYPVDDNDKHLFKLYRIIALTFDEDGFDSTVGQLKDLANSFATKGKGDDTSIAGIIDMEAVKRAVPIWKAQIAAEEAEASRQEPAQGKTPTVAPDKPPVTASAGSGEAVKVAPPTPAAPDKPPETAPAGGADAAQTQAAARAYEKTMNSPAGNISAYDEFQSAQPVKKGESK